MKGTIMDIHELANIFPMIGEEELKELCADIERNGLAEPITLYEGKVIDGRNRATACQRLGIEPDTIEYIGGDPVAFVLSKNLHRRHLTESQRAMVAERLANMQRGGTRQQECRESKAQICALPSAPAISRAKAAKMFNVSERQVDNAAKLRREASPEVVEQVERGEKTIHAALPKKTPKEQPRRKTVAKEREPEHEYIQVERRWEPLVKTMTAWWETMPTAYRQLTGGGEITGCMQVPAPFHHNMMMALFRKMCDDAGDAGEKMRNNLIAEVKLLADRIDELND